MALVEEDKVGGTCLHRGCIPAKALLQSAALLDQVREGHRMGVNAAEVSFDYAVAGRRRDQVVGQLHKGVQGLLKKNKATVVHGRGRLEGPGRVIVATQTGTDQMELEAGHVIVATGENEPARDVSGKTVENLGAAGSEPGDHETQHERPVEHPHQGVPDSDCGTWRTHGPTRVAQFSPASALSSFSSVWVGVIFRFARASSRSVRVSEI